MKNQKVTGTISVSIPILKDLEHEGFTVNVGGLTLSLDGRNFKLYSTTTDYDNPQKKGEDFTFTTELEVDTDTFEENEENNYLLTEKDLLNKELKAEFFCGDEESEDMEALDFENAKLELTIIVDGKEYQIKNVVFE